VNNQSLTLLAVATYVCGQLEAGDAHHMVDGVQTLAKAKESQISFLSNMKYKADLENTQAGVVLLANDAELPKDISLSVIRVKDPYVAFTMMQRHFYPAPVSTGVIHASATIDQTIKLEPSVQIDAQVSIGKDVCIGEGSIIGAGCILADGVTIGKHCLLHPRVVLELGTQLGDRVIIQSGAVLGSDGFGFAWTGDEFLKIPQVGHVVIGNDVEIGANTCIDRGAIENTVVKDGAKLDNLIQVAHGVEIGFKTVIAGQAGIAGSTVIGNGCQMGAQSGVAGHLKLVDGTIVGAKAGVIGDVKVSGMVSGFPAVPHRHWLKASALFDRLPKIWNKIKHLS